MKKITLMFLMLFSAFSFAQLQVGTGNNEGQNMPFEPFYGYTYSQSIYTSAEINTSGTITGLQYYFSGTTLLPNSQDITIYIGHTTKTAFASTTDWEPVTGLTASYTGGIDVSAGAGWVTLTLDTPFAYNGTDNLLIAFDENMAAWDNSADDFWNSATPEVRSITYRNDNTNPDPATPPTATGTYSFSPTIIFNGLMASLPPNCDAALTSPANGATDGSISGDITWSGATGSATDYLLSVGTTSGGTEVFTGLVGNVTSYSLGALAESTTYYVNIVPSNANGSATGCTEYSFTTLTPLDGDFITNPIAFVPSPEETVCDPAEYPFSYDFTSGYTDSGLDGTCNGTDTGLDIFLSWTATSDAIVWNDGAGGPGIVVRDAATGNEVTCSATFAGPDLVLSGWAIGDELIFQVYDFGTASVNPLSFCMAEFTLPTAPDCATGLMPADATTGIAGGTVNLSWTAAATGVAATTYQVYTGTMADLSDLTLVTTVTAPTTTYNLTNVGFNTTIYWQVRPVNGPSANDTCDVQSFTTAAPPTGAVCEDPILVAIPYNITGTTNGFGDDYAGSPGATACGTTSGYLNGDDIVYAYTATADIEISIDLTPDAGNTWSGVFVYTDCADIGTACIAGIGNSGTDIREIDLPVTNGTTYYIVISTFAAPQTVSYSLDIFENTCSDSVATYTVVNDCDVSGGFLIDVEITDMGSATDLTISNDQDATTFAVTAIGTVQFGPFVNATDVVITVADDNDAACTYSSAALTQVACPPSNDDISGAIELTLGASNCDGVMNNGTNVAATDSAEGAGTCFNEGADNDVWFSVTIPAGVTSIDVSTDFLGGTLVDTEIALYSGTSGALTEIACSQDEGIVILSNGSSWNSLITGAAVTEGTYLIQVAGYATTATGTFCIEVNPTPLSNDDCAGATALAFGVEVSVDTTTATQSTATSTCDTASMNDVWYSFTATAASSTVTITTSADHFAIHTDCATAAAISCTSDGVEVSGLVDGTTYYIRVWNDGTPTFAPDGPITLTVSVGTLSTSSFNNELLFTYYPNPVNNNLTLSAQKEISNVGVYNMLGQEVIRTTPNNVTNEVNMSSLQAGAYFVRVTIGDVTETVRVIKN